MRRISVPRVTFTSEWIQKLCADTDELLQTSGELRNSGHFRRLEENARLTREAVAAILVQSNLDRPDVARMLLQNWITFTYQGMLTRLRISHPSNR
jgi:hypothetical protein